MTNVHVFLLSVHGLIRGDNPEYGRDADTGGQVKYVIELAQALSTHPQIARVDILTRLIIDPSLSTDYSNPIEKISDNLCIGRLAFGPKGYLRKENLWPYLAEFYNAALKYIETHRKSRAILIHSHYADAGAVGICLAKHLCVPHIHTGHSLGKPKRLKLLEAGMTSSETEFLYKLRTRIAAEENILKNIDLLVASTNYEVQNHYTLYESFQPKIALVNPPGIPTAVFHPPKTVEDLSATQLLMESSFRHSNRPLILAISRPDKCKNLSSLVRAYAETPRLRDTANLVIVSGTSHGNSWLPPQPRLSLQNLSELIDSYELNGRAICLDHLSSDQIAKLFRLAFKRRGMFVNPALAEPFGLAVIEAGASGLPLIATKEGGPSEIIELCQNGILVDPLNINSMGEAMLHLLKDDALWERYSKKGIERTIKHFSWQAHVSAYLCRTLALLPNIFIPIENRGNS